ncbi:acyltransferase [Psychrosphaera sp. B3R10]|uniref:acyltransferase n=1 Tax=unclassified Psychrosphaera TaxID=2641570 RepID=UPI001C0841E4|nr:MULTISPECIES: acyltransferase [unclassified Psychrosphaera]MBU2880385.1 acyltransferase [Psychrosphaera sp. I2R16]MBU2987824.1 acyltransferase [Psychrosphaera sp. B3R10]MDO6720666.1 acyltransferase [Psychrosphaera sp. 1_MG-2023]
MLSFLPPWLLIFITLPLFFSITALVATSIFILGIIKLILPFKIVATILNFFINAIWRSWAIGNLFAINLTNPVVWEIDDLDDFDKKSWYLLICNHVSWVDIMVLTQIALNTLPSPKFFLKNELKRTPFIGMAAWAMDMPFMKRYSRSYLEKHPEKKGQDIESTKKSCEKFKDIPTTIINFVEGTRVSPQKQKETKSPFKYLLPPRAGGIAFTLAAMGHLFSGVLNVTLNYPDNQNATTSILFGKLKRVQVRVEVLEVNDDIVGDYFNDESFKVRFQTWLNDLWLEKDKVLARLNKW